MMVFLFLLPFFRPFGFPDWPCFQECDLGGFLKPISDASEESSSERECLTAVDALS